MRLVGVFEWPGAILGFLARHLVLLIITGFVVVGWYMQDDLAVLAGGQRQSTAVVGVNTSATDAATPAVVATEPPDEPPLEQQADVAAADDIVPEQQLPDTTAPRGGQAEGAADEPAAPVAATLPIEQGNASDFGATVDAPPVDSASTDEPALIPLPAPADDPSQVPPESLRQTWYDARKAYWFGDLAAAEEQYRAAAGQTGVSAAVWGELGNVLLEMNQGGEAAMAYYQSALVHLQAGDWVTAEALVGVIGKLDSPLAEQLQERLVSADTQ